MITTQNKKFVFFVSGIGVNQKDVTLRDISANLLVISNNENLIKSLSDKYLIETIEFEKLVINSLKYTENSDYQIVENTPLLNFVSSSKNNRYSNNNSISKIKEESRCFSEYTKENNESVVNILKDIKIENKDKISFFPFLVITKNIELNKLKSKGSSIVITDYLDSNFKGKKKTLNIKLSMIIVILLIVLVLGY